MKLTCGVLTTVFIVLGSVAPALADDTAHDKAVAAFQEGRKYIEAGNCDGAVTKLRESLSFEPSVGARLSLGDCLEKIDPLAAWRVFKEAGNLAYINHDDRLSVADTKAAALEKRLPTIRVNIPQAVLEQPGFELRVDGELIDRFFYRSGVIATKPGKHVIEASAPLRHWSEQVTLSDSGASSQLNVQLQTDTCSTTAAPGAIVAPVAIARENPGSTRRMLGLTIAGAGVVGLATGAVFGILTLNKKSKIEDLCGGNAGECAAAPGSLDAERESASTTATISTASFIVGGAALIGGGLLYFTAPSASASTAKVRITPRVSMGGAGMGLEGTW